MNSFFYKHMKYVDLINPTTFYNLYPVPHHSFTHYCINFVFLFIFTSLFGFRITYHLCDPHFYFYMFKETYYTIKFGHWCLPCCMVYCSDTVYLHDVIEYYVIQLILSSIKMFSLFPVLHFYPPRLW